MATNALSAPIATPGAGDANQTARAVRIQRALSAGHTPSEVLDAIAAHDGYYGPRIKAARAGGVSDADLIDTLQRSTGGPAFSAGTAPAAPRSRVAAAVGVSSSAPAEAPRPAPRNDMEARARATEETFQRAGQHFSNMAARDASGQPVYNALSEAGAGAWDALGGVQQWLTQPVANLGDTIGRVPEAATGGVFDRHIVGDSLAAGATAATGIKGAPARPVAPLGPVGYTVARVTNALDRAKGAQLASQAEALTAAGGPATVRQGNALSYAGPTSLPPRAGAQTVAPVRPSTAIMAHASQPPAVRPPPAPPVAPSAPAAAAVLAPHEQAVAAVLRSTLAADRLDPHAALARMQTTGGLPVHVGRNMETLGSAMAAHPGEASTILDEALNQHRDTLPNRFRSDPMVGDRTALETRQGMVDARRQQGNLDMSGPQGTEGQLVRLTPESIRLLRTGAGRRALQQAYDHLEVHGSPEVANDLRETMTRIDNPALEQATPDITMPVRAIQDVTQRWGTQANELRRALNANQPGVDTSNMLTLERLTNTLRTNGRTPELGGFPEYDQFLRTQQQGFEQERAFDLGMNAFGSGAHNTPPHVSAQLENMTSPNVREAYARGVSEALAEQVRKNGGDVSAARRIMNDENVRDRLRMAFPDDASFTDFLGRVNDHVRQWNASGTILRNSQTAARQEVLNALRDQDRGALAQMGITWPEALHALAHPHTGIPALVTRIGIRRASEALGRQGDAANVLTNPEANAAMGRALTDPNEFSRIMGVQQQGAQTVMPPSAPTPPTVNVTPRGRDMGGSMMGGRSMNTGRPALADPGMGRGGAWGHDAPLQRGSVRGASNTPTAQEPASGGPVPPEAQVAFEVNPGQDNPQHGAFAALHPEDQAEVTRRVVGDIIPEVARTFGTHLEVRPASGGWEGATSPSLMLHVSDPSKTTAVAKALGHVLDQDGMFVVSRNSFDGSAPTGVIAVHLPPGSTHADVAGVYDRLWSLKNPNTGEPLVMGHTSDPAAGRMLILHNPADHGGLTTEEAGRLVDEHLGGAYTVESVPNGAHSALFSKGEDYGSQGAGVAGPDAGGQPAAQGLDHLRSRAQASLDHWVGQAQGSGPYPEGGRGALGFGGDTVRPPGLVERKPGVPDATVATNKGGVPANVPEEPVRQPTISSTRPEITAHNVQAWANNHPGINATGDAATDLHRVVSLGSRNLTWVWDHVPAPLRQAWSKWYNSANETGRRIAADHGLPDNAGHAIVATLSPQNAWPNNVTQAERVTDILAHAQNHAWDEKMQAVSQRIPAPKGIPWSSIQGRTLADVQAQLGDMGAAAWVRAFDEAHNARSHREPLPTGGYGDFVRNGSGTERSSNWNSYDPIAKAISVFRDPSPENVSRALGEKNKVRSFGVNIMDPDEPNTVTGDTHNVAAAQMRPLGGSDTAVHQNFGTSPDTSKQGPDWAPARSDKNTGALGTYALNAEMVRRAAAERGVLPRQMQSVTWEAVRQLFDGKKTAATKAKVDAIWARHASGEITQEQALQQIVEAMGGWNFGSAPPKASGATRSYSGPHASPSQPRNALSPQPASGYQKPTTRNALLAAE